MTAGSGSRGPRQQTAPEPSPSLAARDRQADDFDPKCLWGRGLCPFREGRESVDCPWTRETDRPEPLKHHSARLEKHPIGNGGVDIMLATLSISTISIDRYQDYSALAALVRQAREGDRAAFSLLVEQFERTVYAICLRRLGNPSEALELTQEVFLHVLRRIGQLREPERFAGWLRQVTIRMAINRATRRIALPSVETDVLESATGYLDNPLDSLISRERAERLWAGIERLKPLDREVLVAFYIQGQSLVEIAEEFDAPIGTIKRRLHTARKRLKAELESTATDEWSEGSGDPEVSDEGFEREAELVGAGSDSLGRW